MTKVKHTEQHQGNVVCKGKLVLIKSKKEELLVYSEFSDTIFHNESHTPIVPEDHYIKPIIISETEPIEVGDKYFNAVRETIETCKDEEQKQLIIECKENTSTEITKKIIVLPSDFSPEQLQMMVEGKLKDGDEVMVECREGYKYMDYQKLTKSGYYYEIKLDTNNHITLFTVEKEKRLSGKELEYLEESLHINTPSKTFREEESWDDIEKILYNNVEMESDYIKYLAENYHPPKRK